MFRCSLWKGECNMQKGTTIKTTCPNCGDVELGVEDLTAMVCSTTQSASYAFRCPSCGAAVSKPTGRRVVDVLVSSGVTLRTWKLPEELIERHEGPPIAESDVEALLVELEDENFMSNVLAMVQRHRRQGVAGDAT